MKTNIWYKFSIILGMCLLFLGTNIQMSSAQADAKSTFSLGKQKAQKSPIPGEGAIKGTVVVLGKKKKVPLAFIEVDGGRSIQADTKGRFELVLEHGTYKVKLACSGYKDLIIENIAVQDGTDTYIVIELATIETGKFK